MRTTSVLVRDVAELERITDRWDEFARANGKPACAPDWMLGWHEHVLPQAEIMSVLVYGDDDLVGIAPFVLDRTGGRRDVRVMGAGLLQRIGPLARPGLEHVVAAAVGEHLGSLRPKPDVIALESLSEKEGWPALLRSGIRRYAPSRLHWTSQQPAPIATLEGHSFDSWMATRSANFRSEMRRSRRRLAERGGAVRLVTGGSADLPAAVEALGALHRLRWVPTGHPGVIGPEVENLIVAVGRAQAATDRLRLWIVELDGRPVSAQLFLAAGRELSYWNGGWDDAYRDLKPGMMGILAAIEDATTRGESRLDLGGGAQPYKLRFADTDDPLGWSVVAPLKPRYAVTRLQLLRQQSRWRARRVFHQLSPSTQSRIKGALRKR